MQKTGPGVVNQDWISFFRAKSGDHRAWRELLDKYQSRLLAIALLITGSSSSAEDIVQETFMRAFKADISHVNGNVQGYLGTISYRLAVKEAERQKRNIDINKKNLADGRNNPLSKILIEERDRHVADAIRSLDKLHQDVLILRFYSELSYEEIADLLKTPLGTVKSRIFYAIKACRNILQEKGIL